MPYRLDPMWWDWIYVTKTIDGFDFDFVTQGQTQTRGLVINPDSFSTDPAYHKALGKAVFFYKKLQEISRLGFEMYEQSIGRRERINHDIYNQIIYLIDFYWPELSHQRQGLEALKAELDIIRFPPRKEPVKTPKKGYVYLISGYDNLHKIGYSKNPRSRIEKIRHDLRISALQFVCLLPTNDMETLEAKLHNQFREKRVVGEWFALEEDDIIYIKGLA